MADYGDIAKVRMLLRAAPNATLNADAEARLVDLQKVISRWIEHETGRTFGTAADSASIVVSGDGSDILVLPSPAKTVTAVSFDPSYAAGVWTDGTAIDAGSYVLDFINAAGEALALRALSGVWSGPYLVTGTFAGDDYPTVPDDITYLANYLIAEQFKREQMTPAGLQGPDGAIVPMRNPYTDPLVKSIVAAYSTRPAFIF